MGKSRDAESGTARLADTVERLLDRLRVYCLSTELKAKFALPPPYRQRTSAHTPGFWQKRVLVCPGAIRDMQTDNGSEFFGEFEELLTAEELPQLFTYLRCPNVYGCTKRYQGTSSQQFKCMST